MKKNQVRMIIDIIMTVLLPLLMAYSLIGEMFHEIVGTAILVLFIVHNIMNRKWYGALFKGKYNARRIFQTVLNLTLIIFIILQPVSGILMSKHLYTFLPTFSVSAFARSLHMILAYWGYVLLCIHAGTHLLPMISKLRKKKIRLAVFCALATAISAYGVYAFIKCRFPGYMSGRMMFAFFDYSEPRIFFFLDYFTIMILFMMFGYLAAYGLGRIDIKRKVEEK